MRKRGLMGWIIAMICCVPLSGCGCATSDGLAVSVRSLCLDTAAADAGIVSVNVLPLRAVNKRVNWSLAWPQGTALSADPTDYVTIEPLNDDRTQVRLTAIAPFPAIILTAQSEDNPAVTADYTLRQYVSSNFLSAQPVINNSQTILADFGRDVTISAVIGFSVANFTMGSSAGAVVDYRKDDGTHQYRTGGHFGWHVGETYNGVYSNKLENVTCRYIVFYGYDDGYAVMNGTIQNAMMNLGATLLPYEPYAGHTTNTVSRYET